MNMLRRFCAKVITLCTKVKTFAAKITRRNNNRRPDSQPTATSQLTVPSQPTAEPQPTVASQPVAATQPTAAPQPTALSQTTIDSQTITPSQTATVSQPIATSETASPSQAIGQSHSDDTSDKAFKRLLNSVKVADKIVGVLHVPVLKTAVGNLLEVLKTIKVCSSHMHLCLYIIFQLRNRQVGKMQRHSRNSATTSKNCIAF